MAGANTGSSHVAVSDIPGRGFGPNGVKPQHGSVIQRMGSRETLVFDANQNRWFSQNDDLGAKLDAIQANTERIADASERMAEFLELIAAKL